MMTFLTMWFLSHLENSSSEANPPPQETKTWPVYSVALHIFLPVAAFFILWGRRDILTRLLLPIDRSCLAVCCPSFSKREKLLKWASENLPHSWSSPSRTLSGGIPDLWKDGSLLCTLINMAVPGACSNPPKHWRKPPTHAQALIYKYFGIIPVFTEKEFESTLSPIQERKFLSYLQELEQAMKKYNAREQPTTLSSKYLVKGMGLQTGEQYRKTIFYIYANTTDSNSNNILVYIRGPYGTQGTATIPAFYNLNSPHVLKYLHKQFRVSDKIILKKETRKSFLKSIALDFSSFVNPERKVLTNDIPIHIDMEEDRAKVTYIPSNFGIYEVNLITNGEIIAGSPFSVSIIENISGVRDSFENSENIIKNLPKSDKKKIISRVIDCIDEKIELTSNIEEKNIDAIAAATVVTKDSEISKLYQHTESFGETLPCAIIQYQMVSNERDGIEKKQEDQLKQKQNMIIESGELNGKTDTKKDTKISTENKCINNNVKINFTNIASNILRNNMVDKSSETIQSTKATGALPIRNIYPIKEAFIHNDDKELYKDIENNEIQNRINSMNNKQRPTSVVSPFLMSSKYGENIEKSTDNADEQSKCNFLTESIGKISNENVNVNFSSDLYLDTEKSNKISGKSLENSPISEDFAPENLLLSIKQKNMDQNECVKNLKTILAKKLKFLSEDQKQLKDFVNTTNKIKNLTDTPLTQDTTPTNPNTSPICPAHIVPEVEVSKTFGNSSLAEKRCFFSKHQNSLNSSISKEENEGVSTQIGSPYSALRILSVMDSIKKTNLNKNFSKSSPNMQTRDECERANSEKRKIFEEKTNFQKAREYWKNRSMVDLTTSLQERPGNKRIFKSKTLPMPKVIDIYKSADDLSTTRKYNFGNVKLKRSSSLNHKEFEAIEFMSIEERKRRLLQDKFEEENLGKRFVKKLSFSKAKSEDTDEINGHESREKTETIPFSPSRRILNQDENTPNIPNHVKSNEKTSSGFSRAMTFFKDLEKSASSKRKYTEKKRLGTPEIRRRLSLESIKEKRKISKNGGSLRLPKTSERFSITKIYFDIIKNGRGSFKGSANRKAKSETLASITRTNCTEPLENESEICIEYNLFFNKQKPKKRKGIRSLFDLNY